ncbi:uncharacterized protein LOC135821190 [Sycon ciliatum]|uniref:uncharacterized protein LOC135821190 n=1 Tax=Sycon ciliatum TaxID=27933 RepID=UPI0020AAEEBB|eukprot:scpid45609/ scgid29098/ 
MSRLLLGLCLTAVLWISAVHSQANNEDPLSAPNLQPETQPPTDGPPQCDAGTLAGGMDTLDFSALECGEAECTERRDCKFRIGSMGGGPSSRGLCENTITGAREALQQGANSLIMKVCLSRDNVPFVWYDCNMNNAEALARRLGQFTFGMCTPYVHPSVAGLSAHELDFAVIREKWGYRKMFTDCEKAEGSDYAIPTLEEYLKEFAMEPISFVISHSRAGLTRTQTSKIFWMAAKTVLCLGLGDRTILSVSDLAHAEMLQCVIGNAGLDPRQLAVNFRIQPGDIADEVLITQSLAQMETAVATACSNPGVRRVPVPMLRFIQAGFQQLFAMGMEITSNPVGMAKLMKKFQPVKQLNGTCLYGIFIERPDMPNGKEMQEITVSRALQRRNKNRPRLHIYVAVINEHKEMAWHIRQGVDGILTGAVDTLAVVHDTVKACGSENRPAHCTPGGGSSTGEVDQPAVPQQVAELGPPPYITQCVNTDGSATELNTFNKVLRCWATLLKVWSTALEAAQNSVPIFISAE